VRGLELVLENPQRPSTRAKRWGRPGRARGGRVGAGQELLDGATERALHHLDGWLRHVRPQPVLPGATGMAVASWTVRGEGPLTGTRASVPLDGLHERVGFGGVAPGAQVHDGWGAQPG